MNSPIALTPLQVVAKHALQQIEDRARGRLVEPMAARIHTLSTDLEGGSQAANPWVTFQDDHRQALPGEPIGGSETSRAAAQHYYVVTAHSPTVAKAAARGPV